MNFKIIKDQSKKYILNRHLYVGNIIKNIYDPNQYKYICEIGADNMDLAKILAKSYVQVDAYESFLNKNIPEKVSNLNIYGAFSNCININKYDLVVSICPYCYSPDIFDEVDPEEETKELLQTIVNMCIENKKDLFLVLANTYGAIDFLKKMSQNEKYNKILCDAIDLYYVKEGESNISNNKVLILKN